MLAYVIGSSRREQVTFVSGPWTEIQGERIMDGEKHESWLGTEIWELDL